VTLVVCPNLAVDRVLRPPSWRPAPCTGCAACSTRRAARARTWRACCARSAAARCSSASRPAPTGRLIGELAAAEGLDLLLVACEGEARISNVVLEADGRVTELYEHGPEVERGAAAAFFETVAHQASRAGPVGHRQRARAARLRARSSTPVSSRAAARRLPRHGRRGRRCSSPTRCRAARLRQGQRARGLQRGRRSRAGAARLGGRPTLGALAADRRDSDASPAFIPAVSTADCDPALSADADDGERVEHGPRAVPAAGRGGRRRAVVTIGAAGAVALADGRFYHARTEPVEVVSTVGLGRLVRRAPAPRARARRGAWGGVGGGGRGRLGQRRLAPHRPPRPRARSRGSRRRGPHVEPA
jgi:hypothetical protein